MLRFDGFFLKFYFNKIVLYTKQFKILWTRLYGIFCQELKIKLIHHRERQLFLKVFSYSSLIL